MQSVKESACELHADTRVYPLTHSAEITPAAIQA